MKNQLSHSPKTLRLASAIGEDSIASTLEGLAFQSKRFGSCYVPAWIRVRLGFGEHTVGGETYEIRPRGSSFFVTKSMGGLI